MRILIALLLVPAFSSANVLQDNSARYFINGEQNTIINTVLGSSCNSMRMNTIEPVCNPAFFGEKADHTVGLNLLVGRDYEKIYRNRDLITGDDKLTLAQTLLSETKPVHFEGEAQLWWRAERFAISYSPIRATYFSSVRNQAYPDVAVHAMQEQSLQFQAGGFLNANWRAGLNLRSVRRKFVQEEFNLFDAIPDIDNHLQSRSQDVLLIEPGIAYEFQGDETIQQYRPILAAKISNTGYRSTSYSDVPEDSILDTGLSVSPQISWGQLEYSIHYRYSSELPNERKFRWGFQYGVEGLNLALGYDNDQIGLGSQFNVYGVGLGLMYLRNRIEDFAGRTSFEESGYLELRLSI
jgi:hypothetical protein